MSIPPDDLPGMVAWLAREIAEIKRRERNRSRDGKVIDAKPADGLYKVRLREAEGDEPAYDTGWIGVEALSTGTVKIQGEPAIGQPVRVKSESGDMTDAVISLSSFSDANQRPHDKNGELKITVSDGAYSQLLASDGSETTRAKGRIHDTDEDVIFNTGGIVRFN